MSQVGGVHGADERKVIHLLAEVRHGFRDPHAALSVPRKTEGAPHQGPRIADVLDIARDLLEVRFPVMLFEHGFRVKKVHLTRAAVHEEVNDSVRPGLEMRRP